jgi:sporulation protein YlmC with PRC-barrel domain
MNTKANLNNENNSGHNELGPNANRPVRILTATSIIGDKVLDKKGENIGKIKDIMISIGDGKIEYIIMEVGGFMGIGEKLFAIPFSKLNLHPVDVNFVLDINRKSLEDAPGFDPTHWPETNSHYLDVDAYWGSFVGPHTAVLSI